MEFKSILKKQIWKFALIFYLELLKIKLNRKNQKKKIKEKERSLI